MPAQRRMSRVLDRHCFEAISASAVPDGSQAGLMLLDRDFRIRGVNATYEAISMRRRDQLLGECVFDLFPDDPDDPQASGASQLAASVEAAMRRRTTDTMPIVRYDITDPQNPEVFLPKLWTWSNTSVDDGPEQVGVVLRVAEITSLDAALSALSASMAGGHLLGSAEQLHVLSALADRVRASQARAQAIFEENEQLRRAVESRDIIGQAKGLLMERYDVDAAAAFDLLVRLSQRSNTRVEDIARKLVDIDHPSG